ncbi:hypothetical protein HNQ91_002024 [Filimonas zeae]|uniref:FecR family protein n=1 Tax=Filimonas zeae TaxID=1737353 RepID=A0A917MV65_9BACT|nr:FecR family protein [Filimonas zeae]MDR6338973.1 hypothetical protein [Filimonas zeae]GGH65709.1 hypothetical protein GCM10011379_19130 [Filimonas zeae]
MSIQELLAATENNAELVDLILWDRYVGLTKQGNARMQQLMQQPGAEEAFLLCEYYLDTNALPEQEEQQQLLLLRKELLEKSAALPVFITTPETPVHTTRVKSVIFRQWHYYAAGFAAAVAGVYFYFQHPITTHKPVTKDVAIVAPAKDVAPGRDQAVLRLANGDTVLLGTRQPGNIATEGNTHVIQMNGGMLFYEAASGNAASGTAMVYNSITTPRAGKYALELEDGTKVWLNAASSLRYPVAFNGRERVVEVSGEAYFEVAANARKPFIVKAGKHTVHVLGTHFNISAYPEETTVNTTLLEGSVRVTNGEVAQYLNPGQQAQASNGAFNIKLNPNPDLEDVMAWKNGVFYLNASSLNHLMLQVCRWYDMDVEYINVNKSAGRFMGTIPRDVPLSQVLYLLELTGSIHFSVEGKKILVRQ